MLEESNPDRARRGSGTYSVAELRPAAGAICAARLISDIEAISLTNQEGTPDIPGYRSARLFPPEQVQAALSRRVFDAGTEPETVDYAHRTTAGISCRRIPGDADPKWIASWAGHGSGRRGRPSGPRTPRPSCLAGHSSSGIRRPTYRGGPLRRTRLRRQRHRSRRRPAPTSCANWTASRNPIRGFRSGNWQSLPIGALARSDMVEEFRAVLNNPDSGFGIRSVLVDALSLGTPIPEMLPDLEDSCAAGFAFRGTRSRAQCAASTGRGE